MKHASQVMAEMEEDEAAEEQQDAKEPDEGVSPTVLMQAAGLMYHESCGWHL